MKKSLLRWLALLALLLAGCRADQATKAWASASFQDGPRTLVPGLLEFRYAENPAIAFSLLRDVPEKVRLPLIVIMAGISLAALLAFAWTRRHAGIWSLVPFVLILAGGLGNLQDRFMRGYVVDFVHLHWQYRWSWPIFNLADSLITVGLALFVLQALRARKAPAPPPEAAPA